MVSIRRLSRRGESATRLTVVHGDTPDTRTFKTYPIGCCHIDIAIVRTALGAPYRNVAIGRTRKFACVQSGCKTGRSAVSTFPTALTEAVRYKAHTVLTDNGIQRAFPPRYANGPTARFISPIFRMRCRENGIEHCFTKLQPPWTNGQCQRMDSTIGRPPSTATTTAATNEFEIGSSTDRSQSGPGYEGGRIGGKAR